jgi:hypothetical protein
VVLKANEKLKYCFKDFKKRTNGKKRRSLAFFTTCFFRWEIKLLGFLFGKAEPKPEQVKNKEKPCEKQNNLGSALFFTK